MSTDANIVANRKRKHRFMLNLSSDLYDWIREAAFKQNTSMSCQINTVIRDALEKQSKKKG